MPIITKKGARSRGINLFSGHPGGIRFAMSGKIREMRATVLVMESEPLKLRVLYRDQQENEDEDLYRFRIQTPWIYFMARVIEETVDVATVWFAKKKAEDLSEEVFFTPFPNIMNRGNICLSEFEGNREARNAEEASHVVRSLFHHFFHTGFNNDIWCGGRVCPGNFRKLKRYRLHRIFEDWETCDRKQTPIQWKHFRQMNGRGEIQTLHEAMGFTFNFNDCRY